MSEGAGFLLVVIAGLLQATYFLPLKYVNPWKWENIWFVYAVLSLFAFPAGVALATVPHLAQVYSLTPSAGVARVFLFGAGWGIGSVLSGLGVARMGLAMGVSVLIGITAALGSLIPLVTGSPELVFAKKGLMVIAAVITLLVGVALVGIAGKKRDEAQAASGAPPQTTGSFKAGLLICIFSGIFSSMLNFAFAFSKSLSDAAVQLGASGSGALNAVWMLALLGGFIPNCAYTIYLLTRNKSWSAYGLPRTGLFWLYGLAMGLLWYGGLVLYGRGATAMGSLGAVIGWPLFMASLILFSTIWGSITGEWKGAGRSAKQFMVAGLAVLMVASSMLGVANRL